jgi:hypothetical protein
MSDGYQGFDPFRWARTMQTTMQELRRDVEDAAMRNYQMGALLNSAGRVTLNHGGEGISWPVMYRHHRAEGATGENTRVFRPTNLWKTANTEYRGYEVTDSIKRREVEKNKGEAAIIKVMDGFTDRLKQSIIHELGPQFYINGDKAGNEKFWHGLLSLYKQAGQTLNVSTGAARARNDADRVIAPSGSYADIDCALGAYGGAQKTTGVAWPIGEADTHYDFWSPLMIQRDSTAFAGSTVGAQLQEALRFGIVHAQRNSDQNGQMTNVWLDRSLYIEFANSYNAKQTIEVTSGTSLYSLGFRNVIIFDGIEVSWEAAVPVGFGFGLNINNIELMGMTSDLYYVEGPEYDINTQSFNAVVSTLSNMKYRSPRNFAIWAPASAVV